MNYSLNLSAFPVFSLFESSFNVPTAYDMKVVLGMTAVLLRLGILAFSCFLTISSLTKALLLSMILLILSICFFFNSESSTALDLALSFVRSILIFFSSIFPSFSFCIVFFAVVMTGVMVIS